MTAHTDQLTPAINWPDWMPAPAQDWEPKGLVLLSGPSYETAPLVEDMAAALPARILTLDLGQEKFGRLDEERYMTTRPLTGGDFTRTRHDIEGELPETPEVFDTFFGQVRDDDTHIIIPKFVLPPDPKQSERLLIHLGAVSAVVIICVEPTQRRPVPGPPIWMEKANRIISVKNGVLRDLKSGASSSATCSDVLRELLAAGPVPYENVRRATLGRFAEQTVRNCLSRMRVRTVEYLVSDEGSV